MADETQHQDASGTADLSGVSRSGFFSATAARMPAATLAASSTFCVEGWEVNPASVKTRSSWTSTRSLQVSTFADVIEQAVGSCDVFIAVIGKQWLNAVDARGRRRLDNAQDFVRLEIEAALERDIPVVPALVQGAEMPSVEELPETFHAFGYRNAVELSDTRWPYDVGRLVGVAQDGRGGRRHGGLQAEHDQADEATHEGETDDVVEGGPDEPRDRDGDGEERRRFGRKHVILVAALLTLAVAGIAGAMALVSGSGSEESPPTDAAPTQEPTPTPGDDDGDGLPDAEDPFALDPENGSELPVELAFTDAVAGTIEGSGFTGLMTDGTTPYDELFDADNVIVDDGTFRISSVGRGAAAEEEDEQRNGFQFGIRVPDESFTAHARLIEPFADRVRPK